MALEFGNNVCVYGLGNKEKLLCEVAKQYEEEKVIIDIKGYDKNLLQNNIILKFFLSLQEAMGQQTSEHFNFKSKHSHAKILEEAKKIILKEEPMRGSDEE